MFIAARYITFFVRKASICYGYVCHDELFKASWTHDVLDSFVEVFAISSKNAA